MGMELKVVDDNSNTDGSALSFKQDIVRLLINSTKKETAEYEKLLLQWRELRLDDPESDDFLKLRLKALSQAVSFIKEGHHDMLLSYIFGMSLWMHDSEVADALIEFTINLATVNGGCVMRCLDMLVRNFLPPSSGLPIFIDFFSRRSLMKGMLKEALIQRQIEHIGRKEEILKRIHCAILRISELVPMTALHLKHIVIQRMPHRVVDKEWNVMYLENMLRLAQDSSGEFLRSQMLMAVVDRLIEIDVEIRWEDIVREDDSNKIFIFDMEFDEMLDDTQTFAQAGPGSEAQQDLSVACGERRQSLCAVADKMDILMDLTLEHMKNYANTGHIEQVFNILMNSFQSTILDTHKSKFTQFLIFYICSIAPTTCGAKFAALLCDILTSADRAPNTRMSAAAYLASFLARAKHLPLVVISSSLKRVVDWCIKYTPKKIDNKSLMVDAGVHGVFYSACQAVMYVLCFRMRALLLDLHGREALRILCLNDFLRHSLNPLKLCLPSVVEEFLKQATKAHLVDARLSNEVNGTIENLDANTFGGTNRLDMFFPFDPYLLKQSDRFIRPNFIFWSMVQSHDDEDDDDTSDVELECDESESDRSSRTTDECSDVCMTPSSIPRSAESTVIEIGNFGNSKPIDDFELSMNRMSLTSNEVSLQFLEQIKQPIPLPPKLTPEYLWDLSTSSLLK